ncbi:MAG TPA: DUF4277 domain-containing protein, partial [Blastocatellia bacterium]|nr:DUF4277 domain-containing protein [Blastocatellia bacterium]
MSNNAENLPITNERGDDIPLLIAQLKEMRVPELLNQSFPTHGNWQGLSPGHLVTLWLTFILSESNHRISHLRSWAADRLQTLADCLGLPLVESDFTDDRLTQALDYLSDQEGWRIFEDLILLEVNIDLRRVEQEVRAYGDRQASVRVKEELSVSVRMKAEAVAEAKQALGWRG